MLVLAQTRFNQEFFLSVVPQFIPLRSTLLYWLVEVKYEKHEKPNKTASYLNRSNPSVFTSATVLGSGQLMLAAFRGQKFAVRGQMPAQRNELVICTINWSCNENELLIGM